MCCRLHALYHRRPLNPSIHPSIHPISLHHCSQAISITSRYSYVIHMEDLASRVCTLMISRAFLGLIFQGPQFMQLFLSIFILAFRVFTASIIAQAPSKRWVSRDMEDTVL
ncbi:hypothetical protein EJ02DRAFT_15150 [Clathrospora elynae]|uniref:Uncharacterized protein n=1 Tax=Clathrospora elynae TaxID=706981 RepID=A0A6A5T073_9PLEO|nr:hypothetical protein EJ02DRAFT_15150 [Clathrospora elynae]